MFQDLHEKKNKEYLFQLQRVIPGYSLEAPKRTGAWARKNVNIQKTTGVG